MGFAFEKNLEILWMEHYPVVITGAGPAGLTAAYELTKQGIKPIVLESADKVGGISRTEVYKGYRFDLGGHRFFTKVVAVQQLWKEVLGEEFLKVPRMSRIYYQGKFFDYPLSIFNTLSNLGILPSFFILLSYLKAKLKKRLRPGPEPETFDQWVIDRFGRRLYRIFFQTYTEKVWGIACNKIQADWAAQRIQGMSLKKAVFNALFGTHKTASLIKEFDYPVLGPGMMWERFQEAVESKGGQVCLNTPVIRVERDGNRITGITAQRDGETIQISGDQFISTMPVTALIQRLDPPAPDEVIHAAKSLSYRAFIIVALVVDHPDLFPDNWIYIHSPEVKVGRIQNFKNWSPAMVPDPSKTCLGMEYFCSEGDEIWTMSDTELLELATRELGSLGLAKAGAVEDGTILRQPKAYPVYDRDYREHLQVIQNYLETFENLQTVGRNGMHRYNNQDHSMLTAMLAVKNLQGEKHDLWQVNVERSYHEEFTKEEWQQTQEPAATPEAAIR
jgi:protoporphyrinogen oxidase